MTESSGAAGGSQGREPDGDEQAKTSEVGEPRRGLEHDEKRALEEERPDLDERQSRISTRRKPMGPPLDDLEERAEDLAREAAPETPPEPPTDPSES